MKITINDEIEAMERELERLQLQNSDYVGYNFPSKEMEERHYFSVKSVLIRLYKIALNMMKSGELVIVNGVVTEKPMEEKNAKILLITPVAEVTEYLDLIEADSLEEAKKGNYTVIKELEPDKGLPCELGENDPPRIEELDEDDLKEYELEQPKVPKIIITEDPKPWHNDPECHKCKATEG